MSIWNSENECGLGNDFDDGGTRKRANIMMGTDGNERRC
jgi:hypothetical protein